MYAVKIELKGMVLLDLEEIIIVGWDRGKLWYPWRKGDKKC